MISTLLTIIHKEWRHILRDKGTFFIVIIGPVILSVAFSLILHTDVRTVKVVAVVPHHSEASRSLISRFENNPVFRFKGYVNDLAEAERMMRINEVNAAVVFDPDFEQSHSVQIAADVSNCTMGSAASIYIRAVIDAELSGESESLISYRMLYNPRMISAYSFQPGIIALVILILMTVLTSSSLVREKEYGTIDSVTCRHQCLLFCQINAVLRTWFVGWRHHTCCGHLGDRNTCQRVLFRHLPRHCPLYLHNDAFGGVYRSRHVESG